jgi:hypothetical protein
MLTTKWTRPAVNDWYCLGSVNCAAIAISGVYIIWRSGKTPWTVRVGQGDIAGRLSAHKHDPKILAYSSLAGLRSHGLKYRSLIGTALSGILLISFIH